MRGTHQWAPDLMRACRFDAVAAAERYPDDWGISRKLATPTRLAHTWPMTAGTPPPRETPPPMGWYRASDGTHEQWWDGQSWTRHVRPLSAPPPKLADAVTTSAVSPRKARTEAVHPGNIVVGWVVIAFIVTVIGFILFWKPPATAAGSTESTATQAVAEEAVLPENRVSYRVDGTAQSASITATTPGGMQQHDVALPMTTTSGEVGLSFQSSPGEFVYISAQNRSDEGTVTCSIMLDGLVVATNTSTAAYGIATCEYSIPFG